MRNNELNNPLIYNACQILEDGGVIIIPTETVYGIAVDATNKSAIDKIYQIKKRSNEKPLQIMCSDMEMAKLCAEFSGGCESFCGDNWPGALTAVVKMRKDANISPNFNLINDTVGIRIPDHQFLRELIQQFGKPLAVSSANISGEGDARSVEEIESDILEKMDMIIDKGESKIGYASTVIDFTGDKPIVLRQGQVKLPA